MKKINFKRLAISLAVPLGVAGLVSYAIKDSVDIYQTLNKPAFAPPKAAFPIAWSILYVLMGVSWYMVNENNGPDSKSATLSFLIQLAVNASWSIFFFNFELYLASFLVLLLLILLIIDMIVKFGKINKKAAALQIPYLAWSLFAGVLNFAIYIMN